MVAAALKELDLAALDCILIENVGNLVCPAEFDTGAARRAVILSVPERGTTNRSSIAACLCLLT